MRDGSLIWPMLRAAARLTGTPMPVIRGTDKSRALVRIRMAVALVARRQGHSLSSISVALGRTDHTTARNLIEQAPHLPDVVALAHRIERIVTGVDPMPPAPDVVVMEPDAPAPLVRKRRTVAVPSTVRITTAGYVNRRGEIVVGPLPGAEVDR
jgi:hypothetical protein